jgi:hypothetical protein
LFSAIIGWSLDQYKTTQKERFDLDLEHSKIASVSVEPDPSHIIIMLILSLLVFMGTNLIWNSDLTMPVIGTFDFFLPSPAISVPMKAA